MISETQIGRKQLFDGVTLITINTNKFKSTRVSVVITMPMSSETASAYSMLPYLLSRSCEEYPEFEQLNRRMAELYGAAISVAVRKTSDSQQMFLGIESLDDRFSLNGSSITRESVELLCKLLFEPNTEGGLNAADFENERRILIEHIENEINEKRIYASSRCDSIMCEGEPFALPGNGTVEQAKALTPEKLLEAWRTVLQTADFKIAMVGSGDASAVAEAFRKGFGAVGRKAPLKTENILNSARPVPAEVTEEMEVNQGKLVLGFRSNVSHNIRGSVPVKIMADIFGGGPYSLLFDNVREKMSLCYYCSAVYNRQKGLIKVNSGVEDKNAQKARQAILEQLDTVKSGSFSNELLETSKRAMIEMCASVCDGISSFGEWYLGQIDEDEVISPEEYAKIIAAVTKEQVVAAANEFALDTVFVLKGKAE